MKKHLSLLLKHSFTKLCVNWKIGENRWSSCNWSRKMETWSHLKVSREDVEIATVLSCGQSFRWKTLESDPESWIGVFANRVWILKQDDAGIQFKVHPEQKHDKQDNRKLLYKYFQLDVNLGELYKCWSSRDERFANLTAEDYRGIRMLYQECVENVFSFICSSNNNISRISQMVVKLCLYYGEEIATVEGKQYYGFPCVENLVGEEVEKKLREEKFGYRAGFIAKTAARIVENGGVAWLENLRTVGYEEARIQLQTLPGIGRKVADCICLMSMGYSQAIPVDTHMHQIAIKYLPHLSKVKTLTDKTYSEITDFFRKLHGNYAGWAHSVLFSSTLRHLKVDTKNANSKRKTDVVGPKEISKSVKTLDCTSNVKRRKRS